MGLRAMDGGGCMRGVAWPRGARGSHSLIPLILCQGLQGVQLVIPLFVMFLHLFPRFLCQSEGEWEPLGVGPGCGPGALACTLATAYT